MKRVLQTEDNCHVAVIMALMCVVLLLVIAIIFF